MVNKTNKLENIYCHECTINFNYIYYLCAYMVEKNITTYAHR